MNDRTETERTETELLEETPGLTRSGYTLTRLVKIGEHKARIRINRDHYQHQSYAVAEVFTPEHTWTLVITSPPSQWHDRMPRLTNDPATHDTAHDTVRGALGSIADDLTNRTVTLLTA